MYLHQHTTVSDEVSTVRFSTNTSPQAEVSRVKQHYEGVAGRARADVERAWLGERGRMAQEIRLLEARVAELVQGSWCAELWWIEARYQLQWNPQNGPSVGVVSCGFTLASVPGLQLHSMAT